MTVDEIIIMAVFMLGVSHYVLAFLRVLTGAPDDQNTSVIVLLSIAAVLISIALKIGVLP